MAKHLILYDGVCGFCNRTVQFILKRDRNKVFSFAPLQSPVSHELLTKHDQDATALNTIYLVENFGQPEERVFKRGRAALRVSLSLGKLWPLMMIFSVLPTFILDWVYNVIARNRYRWFGQLESCPVPSPEQRDRFLGFSD